MANDSRQKRHIVAMSTERGLCYRTKPLRSLSVCSPSIIYAFGLPPRLLPPSLPRRRPTIMLFMPPITAVIGGGSPASVPSSLVAAGVIPRRCDFSTLVFFLVALPHADPHLLRLRVSHNRKKTQEYNERKCALAFFSVLCRYAVALATRLVVAAAAVEPSPCSFVPPARVAAKSACPAAASVLRLRSGGLTRSQATAFFTPFARPNY